MSEQGEPVREEHLREVTTSTDVKGVETESADGSEEEPDLGRAVAVVHTSVPIGLSEPRQQVTFEAGFVSRPSCFLACTLGSRGPPAV